MIFYLLSTLALAALIIGSITDIKKREVPDWINYSLIACGFGFNLIYSVILWDFSYIINSSIGFFIFLIFALIMFYSGQWGGGDSKLLMGLGSAFGINFLFFKMLYFNILNLFKPIYPTFYVEMPFALNFLVNSLLVGALYGLLWSVILIFMNGKSFIRELKKLLNESRKARKCLLVSMPILVAITYFSLDFPNNLIVISLFLLLFLVFYLYTFIKAVENSCMLKYVEPTKLTEGDWIGKDITIDGRHLCGPKDLGISKSQIKEIIGFYNEGKIKKVLIKEGIPFVPSFLVAFILTLIYGNLVLLFI